MTAFRTTQAFAVRRAFDLNKKVIEDPYYLFVADHRPSTNTDLPPVTGSTDDVHYEPWRQMIFGSRVVGACLAIRNNPYSFGTVYPQFDDRVDLDALDPWYAVVNSGSYSHVFGCLYNAGGAASTVMPDFTQVVSGSSLYQTSDGYRWKYMYSVDSGQVATYSSPEWFPFVGNGDVSSTAVDGSIDVITVESGGKLYDNYTAGTFQPSDLKVNGIPTLYQVSNSTIKTANGYYEGCILTITNGVGAGQYARINQYYSSNSGNFINIDTAFLTPPTNGSQFQVLPSVRVVSDGTELKPCVAMALINAVSSNSVYSVQVLDPGIGYFANTTASVVAATVVGVALQANVRPIMPPPGGHGFDQARELGATALTVSATLANTMGGHVPATNQYRTVGLVSDPVFSEVRVSLDHSDGFYFAQEAVRIMSLRTVGLGSISSSTPIITAANNSVPFGSVLTQGMSVYVSNGSAQFVTQIVAVQNTNSLLISANSDFTSSNVTLSLPNVLASGYVNDASSPTDITLTGVTSGFPLGAIVFGTRSKVASPVTAVYRSGVQKGFETFVQLPSYSVTMLGGTFIPNEVLTQNQTTALVHSYANGTLYVSQQSGPIVVGVNVTGQQSGAIGAVTQSYAPELRSGHGTVEYVENVAAVTRQPNQSEQWTVTFNFGA